MLPLLGPGLNWAVLSCAQRDQIVPDIVLCVADFFGSMPRSLRLDVSLHQSSCDVPSSRHRPLGGRGFQGVPVTICSTLSFQRLPSTFRRADRAKTAPFSNPMMCSSLLSDFPSQIAVRQRSSSSVRSGVWGKHVPNRLFRISQCQMCIHAL